MLPYRDSRLTIFLLAIFFCLALGYAFFEARGALFGPTITVSTQVSVVHDPFVTIQGQAQRISSLTMNGSPISVTEDGAFDQPYLLAPGYNRIALDAKDQYGRTREKVIEIMYIPTSTSNAATSSPQINATTTEQYSTSTLPAGSSTQAVAPAQ